MKPNSIANATFYQVAKAIAAYATVRTMDEKQIQDWRITRLAALADREGGKAALGRKLGYKDGAFIGQMLRGERPVSEKTVIAIHAMPGYSSWFSSGRPDQVDKFDANVKRVGSGGRPYPVISMIQAGHLKEMTNPYELRDGFDIEYGDDDASEWAVFLEIKGDSMLPDFKPGDRVRIDPEVVPRPGDFVAAKNSELEATFKKYRVRGIGYNGQEIFELVPLNEDYPILRSDEHSLTVIGTMTEHRRKFRRG